MNYSRLLGPNVPDRCEDSSSRRVQATFPLESLTLEQVPLRGTNYDMNNSDKNSKNNNWYHFLF